jgi:hypothetical protein
MIALCLFCGQLVGVDLFSRRLPMKLFLAVMFFQVLASYSQAKEEKVQAITCQTGRLYFDLAKDQDEDCYKQKIEKTMKVKVCSNEEGYLFDDNKPTDRLYLYKKAWQSRVDTIDYTNELYSTKILRLNTDLTQFEYQYKQETFKKKEIKSLKCLGTLLMQ